MLKRSFLVLFCLMAIFYVGLGSRPEVAGQSETAGDRQPAVYLTDLDKCQPQSSLSRKWKYGTWRLLDYETEPFKGTMLIAVQESGAPEVTYPMKHSGWHKIYIGIFQKPHTPSMQVRVKLTDDPAYTTLTAPEGEKDLLATWLQEIYWKTDDLTGQDITFGQVAPGPSWEGSRQAWVGFVKLVPLTEREAADLEADRRQTDTKRLFMHTDAHYTNLSGSAEYIRSRLEPLRHSDVSRVYWESGGGDYSLYFSDIAFDFSELFDPPPGEGSRPVYPRDFDRLLDQTWKAYHKNGVDPFRVAAEFAHEIGLGFHASYRVASFVAPPPFDLFSKKRFYDRHPELVCVDRDGMPWPRISFAFPETRRFVISMFREVATKFPIDGVCLLYNRRPPLLAYEEPMVQGFQERYGEDPRQLDEKDPRWLSYSASVLTQFMRELREEMNAISREQNRKKPLEIAAVVMGKEENLPYAMDLKTWIEEGLIDTLITSRSSEQHDYNVPDWRDYPEDVAYFVSLVKGTKCRLAMNLYPRHLTPEEYYRTAHVLYQAGVENLFFWDGDGRVNKVPRLGHRQEVEAWMAAGQPSRAPNKVLIRKLGIWDLRIKTPG